MRHSRYLLAVALSFMAVMAAAVGSNWLVDPYGMFATPRIAGFNALKPAAGTHSRIAKAYQVEALRPVTVILGNSRPEMGIDPALGCWREDERPVYNLGLPGAGIDMQVAYLRHAVADGRVAQVLIALDFADFLIDTSAPAPTPGAVPPGYAGHLATAPPMERRLARFEDRFRALVSLDALVDSIGSVLAQSNPDSATLRADGFNPARDYLPIIRAEGQQVLFEQKQASIEAAFARPGQGLLRVADHRNPGLDNLAGLLAELSERGIATTLFINPYHVDYLRALREAGLWSDMDRWKRALAALADSTPGAVLWDFTTLAALATEAKPAAGDRRTRLAWFWEPSHHTAALGALMLDRMLGRDCASPETRTAARGSAAGFGTRLTIDNIDTRLADLAAEFDAYALTRERVAGGVE